MSMYFYFFSVVSRTQQGRQRGPSTKTLHSPFFHRILEVLRVECRNSKARVTATPTIENGNIKYFITSSRNKPTTFVPLRHNWPQSLVYVCIVFIYKHFVIIFIYPITTLIILNGCSIKINS